VGLPAEGEAVGLAPPGKHGRASAVSVEVSVAVEVDEVLRRGGADLVSFLQFCVLSAQMEPVFAFLVREYRAAPSAARALALYDIFCVAGAPARVRAEAVLPPYDLRLPRAIDSLRQSVPSPAPAAGGPEGKSPAVPDTPASYLFDVVLAHLERDANGPLRAVGRQFDPGRGPEGNLPGGRMSAGQRAFLDNIWRPRVRPALVAAGFWRVATLGG
jgi:hypothetical protein